MQITGFSKPWPIYNTPQQTDVQGRQADPGVGGRGQNPPTVGAGDPATSSLPPTPSSVQFNTQLLTALLNAQEGGYHATRSEGDISTGQAHLLLQAHSPGARQASSAIISSAGDLDASTLVGKSATDLADGMIQAFGSNGSLDLAQVDDALGVTGSTVDPNSLDRIKSVIAGMWKSTAGGSDAVSPEQLAIVIGKLQSGAS